MDTIYNELDMETKTSGATEANEHWDIVIEPKTSLFDLRLKDVWRYRDLIMLFVKRELVSQYKQTVLGPIWHVIQPLLTTIMFLILFRKVAKISTDGIEPVLFYMSGITIWYFFATCLTATSGTFVTNANIFGKVYFPRLVLPISVVISNIIKLGIQMALLIVAMIYYGIVGKFSFHITPSLLLAPVVIIIVSGLSLALGIIISALTTKYRDFSVLLTFAVQLGMYASPIGYPLSYVKEGSVLREVLSLNPITPLVEAFRFSLFGQGTFTTGSLMYSLGFTVVALFLGVIIFNKVEKTFMDTV